MKSKNKNPQSAYERARKRVDDIKGFYGHLLAYFVVNIVLLFTKDNFNFYVVENSAFGDSDFLNWINWETYGTPMIWGICLLFHGISVFVKNPFLGKAWEQKQIEKYLNDNP